MKKKKRIMIILLSVVELAVVLAIGFFVWKHYIVKDETRNLEGIWRYNEYTEYEFDGKGNGRMFYEEGKAFDFSYLAREGVLSLDFELEYVNDCEYSYTIKGDKLLLIGGEGTAQIGAEYELTKQLGDKNGD